MNVRVACARILATVIRREASLSTLIPTYQEQVPERDNALLQELVYGSLRHYPALDAVARVLLAKPLKNKDLDIYSVLLCGLYQIREMRTPSHAAVNESVAACQQLKKQWARGLINAALRRYLRERAAIDEVCTRDPAYSNLHPTWLRQSLESAWGEQARDIMAANNQRPPLTLRVNRLRSNRDDYLKLLQEHDIAAHPTRFASQGISLEQPCPVALLPHFAEGWVSVQDEAAQLSAELLDLQPGQRVLDGCCAPGGKTCHILEHQEQLSELVALDVDQERLERVTENLLRLGLNATLVSADASAPEEWWDGQQFDRILLDAPCSATGVIRRHPDIKLLRQSGDIDNLAKIQLRLLQRMWPLLKTGGKLLYATCSILPQENAAVLDQFTSTQSDCKAITIAAPWGIESGVGRQLFPVANQHDGFYYALLEKQPTPTQG